MGHMEIQMNEYQTPLTEELLQTLPHEVVEQLYDYINNVPFIKNLISPNRKYAKDLPRDDEGKIIVDLTNPHIIEDADYFRQPALHFLKHGCYTFLRPNSNPNSEYRKFWDEELRRCLEGYIRPEDGEWVTGYCYWFLNYNPMMVNIIKEGSKKAVRQESFPFFFEGVYYRFHYLYQAREQGKHAIELAKRGAHPYFQKVYTPDGIKKWEEIKIGDKLFGTYGNVTTVTDIPFNNEASTYKITLEDGRVVYASDDHIWNIVTEFTNQIIHVTTKSIYEQYQSNNRIDYFIPNNLGIDPKNAEERLKILYSLLGTKDLDNAVFNTSSRELVHKVEELTRSLGYNCSTKIINTTEDINYQVFIHGFETNEYWETRIINVEYIGEFPCKCVTVDSEDNSYLIGDFIQTHNCSKSYSLSSIMTHNLVLGESPASRKRVMTILAAYQKEYLKDDKDGTFSKFRPSINFIASHTPFPRLMLKNSPNEMSWQMGYKDEFGRDCGSLNTVIGVAVKDDEAKLRGKRGIILFEEMGSMPGLLTVYDTCRRSVEDGDYTFGQMYLVGTTAEDESDFSSAKTLLCNPSGYNIYAIPNVFDKVNQGKKTFGFFFPAYMNRAGCYNKDGISDVIKALIEILLARYTAKYSADPKSLLRVIAEDPITPAEAIIKVKAAYFPVTALTERLTELDANSEIFNNVYIGKLIQDSEGKVKFTPTNDVPIRKYGVENDTPGAIEIYQLPEKNKEGNVYNNRYIIGHDPVDNDMAESSSLSSTFVLDLYTDAIVAEYTGRNQFADDNYEIVRLLCLFYNAKCLYESNKKGIYAYFKRLNCSHLLADTPEYLRDKDIIKYTSFGSNSKGVNATAAVNNYANDLIRNWLLKPVPIVTKTEEGDKEIDISNLYRLKSRALIEELIAFTPELNVDRIRALGMVMLYREEKIILYQGTPNANNDDSNNSTYLGNDSYFNTNYNKRFPKQ